MRFVSSLRPVVCWLLFSGFANPAFAAGFSFIYIEPGEGDSSGGHAAVQFGDDVYHFQHDDSGLIRIKRQNAAEFQFSYQYLQNRPLHLSRIALSTGAYDILLERFKTTFWAQQRQFEQLDQLQYDRSLLQHFLRVKRHQRQTDTAIRLKGVGLFFNDHDVSFAGIPQPPIRQSTSIAQLRRDIEQAYGAHYLQQRLAGINAAVRHLNVDNWHKTRLPLLSADKFPPAMYALSDAYRDLVTAALAIYTLQQARPLLSDAWVIPPMQEFKLNAEEVTHLEMIRQRLRRNIPALLDSERPDWGYAVLVNLARLAAVERSLKTQHWVFVDDFNDRIEAGQAVRRLPQINTLTHDALQNLRQARTRFTIHKQYSESQYSGFEMAANRYVELSKAKQAMRFNGESPLPVKSIALPLWPAPELSEQQINIALAHLDSYNDQLLDELKQPYAYDLIGRNCVTELFRTFYQALGSPPHSRDSHQHFITEQLGGYVDENIHFIPFVAYSAVQNRYRVTDNQTLPSYRQHRLSQQMHEENSLWVSLREANTLSSTLYDYNPDDAFFIFFTDNHWPLRPLFGAVNASAGMGQALAGMVTFPFDNGKNLISGLSGILVSLPELIFVNIRKGSYKYLSYTQFINQNRFKSAE